MPEFPELGRPEFPELTRGDQTFRDPGHASAILTLNYRWNNSTLRFFSTIATFGSPQDVALQEMRIESFFPADEVTRAALTATP